MPGPRPNLTVGHKSNLGSLSHNPSSSSRLQEFLTRSVIHLRITLLPSG